MNWIPPFVVWILETLDFPLRPLPAEPRKRVVTFNELEKEEWLSVDLIVVIEVFIVSASDNNPLLNESNSSFEKSRMNGKCIVNTVLTRFLNKWFHISWFY